MKGIIKKISARVNRAWIGTTPKRRRVMICVLMLVYTAVTLYVLLAPAQDYRFEEYRREETPASDLITEDENASGDNISAGKIREMEEFFNQFNTGSHE